MSPVIEMDEVPEHVGHRFDMHARLKPADRR
jgi:hypothetical protein